MSKHLKITWQAKPDKDDFLAAESYLGLLYGSKAIKAIVSELKASRCSSVPDQNYSDMPSAY